MDRLHHTTLLSKLWEHYWRQGSESKSQRTERTAAKHCVVHMTGTPHSLTHSSCDTCTGSQQSTLQHHAGGTPKASSLTEELLADDGCWKEDCFLQGCSPWYVTTCQRMACIPMWILAVLIGLSVLQKNKGSRWWRWHEARRKIWGRDLSR